MDVIFGLKTFYLGTSAVILLVYLVRPLKERFLAYGPRSASNNVSTKTAVDGSKHDGSPQTLHKAHGSFSVESLLDYLATYQVPHSWFMSFYLVSVTSSIIWQQQLSTRGDLYRAIARSTHAQETSMTSKQIILCSSLMAVQGTRRLWECYIFGKPSQSRMWVFHWLLGVLFYVATSIAIWIEGIPVLESTNWKFGDVRLSAPSPRTLTSLAVFLLASDFQYDIHKHLASLKKYTLPSHRAFNAIVCPHYTAECVIYAALAVLAAPQGSMINRTVMCATIFVVVNLGVTADISKKWTIEKFGKEKVKSKWRMLPGIW